MQYLKRKTKFTIFAFIIIVLSITISISTLAKTEVYFSLYDNPQKAIIKNINQAEAFINIAMYVFTDKEIATSLINAQDKGVKIRVYLDKSQIDSKYSLSRFLVQEGIKVRISSNNYIMHNKFVIIDNRLLLTGSYNWTFSANNRNDENLIVIDNPETIQIYQNQFVNLLTNKFSLNRTKELFNKTKVNLLTIFPPLGQAETKVININTASPEELIQVLKISEPLAQKIIVFPFMSFPRTRESIILREELGGFKEPKDILQLPEITNLEWEEWKEEGIIITVD